MSRIQYKYSVVDRDTGKTINIHNNREDARSDKRDWKSEGFNVTIVQSKYVFIVSKRGAIEMGKVVIRDSHTNANGCSLIEYQFESFDDMIAFEEWKQQSLVDSLKGSGLFTLAETEDFDDEPSVVNINVKKKDKETKH